MLRPGWFAVAVGFALALAAGITLAAGGGEVSKPHAPYQGWVRVDPIEVQVPSNEPLGPTDAGIGPPTDGAVLVNIWASTCVPCVRELPLLERVSSSSPFKIVGVSRDSIPAHAEDAIRAAGVSYGNWLDSGAEFAVALDGRVPLSQVPASVLIVEGVVRAVHIGPFASEDEVRAAEKFL